MFTNHIRSGDKDE
jgi:hypothetical protein